MNITPVVLLTDFFVYLLLIGVVWFGYYTNKNRQYRQVWHRIFSSKLSMAAFIVLSAYALLGMLDSIHFRYKNMGSAHDMTRVYSVFDVLLAPVGQREEKTYSAPLAMHLHSKETQIQADGSSLQVYPRLQLNQHLVDDQAYTSALYQCLFTAMAWSGVVTLGLWLLSYWYLRKRSDIGRLPYKTALAIINFFLVILIIIHVFSADFYLLGTDKIGHEVLYQVLKSVRTGLVIGTLTTLIMLPFALGLGLCAGYFRGWIDDLIQYLYTTLSSIPGVLLIASVILAIQVSLDNHPQLFASSNERADLRLFALCVILGLASWTGLCRLVRAETIKLSSMPYVKAARVLGQSSWAIIAKHITPNLLHIVLITITLDFSGLVLAEAVLSYVGVGVDPLTFSWGNMINAARLEMAREPMVWWPLMAAFVLMFILVLAANIFADAVRDGFDPRSHQA